MFFLWPRITAVDGNKQLEARSHTNCASWQLNSQQSKNTSNLELFFPYINLEDISFFAALPPGWQVHCWYIMTSTGKEKLSMSPDLVLQMIFLLRSTGNVERKHVWKICQLWAASDRSAGEKSQIALVLSLTTIFQMWDAPESDIAADRYELDAW